MTALALLLVASPAILGVYAYIGYPLLLRLIVASRHPAAPPADPERWPFISITVPAYNEEGAIRSTLDAILGADYPPDRREVLVISDASTDRTDAIAGEYESQGVRVIRLPERRGKTAAENVAHQVARGEIVIQTDASVRLRPDSLKPLVRAFGDPTVGVASGRDVSTGAVGAESTSAESGYVGYEMSVRDLETRAGSIIGASGCFYGFRPGVDEPDFPEHLSRDFASALIARERGYRSVSVNDAVCVVPRARAVSKEYRRKTRTMARGLATLWYKRHLMNPVRYGGFALMLVSHKLCRWLVYPAVLASAVGLAMLAPTHPVAAWALGAGIAGTAFGVACLNWPAGRQPPAIIGLFGYATATVLAGLGAWRQLLAGQQAPTWEPTRRPGAS